MNELVPRVLADGNIGPVDAAQVPRYVGEATFARLPRIAEVERADVAVLGVHFDAHLDTWDTYFGAAYTHGMPFRRASEEGLLDQSGCVHVGIRGPLYNDLRQDAALGFQVIGADIVEVAPAYDHAQITGITAAHAGFELLSALAARKAAR